MAAPKSHIVYQVVTSLFAIASVFYVWVLVDSYLELRASLSSSETVEIWGSEWPVSTIHAMVFGGWMLIAGPYAAGVMVLQLGSIFWFRPTRAWLAAGVVVCLVSTFAIWSWIANQQ